MITLTATEEKGLLEKIKTGDAIAFERIYNRYEREVFYSILRLVRLKEAAAEIHQDAFLKLWTGRDKLDAEKPVLALLRHIAKNMVIDFYRKSSRDKSLLDQLAKTMSELHDPVNDAIKEKEVNAAVENAISKLPAQRQQVFRLIKLEHKSYEYAAEHFGVSVGTIKDHMAKAAKFLRAELKFDGSDVLSIILWGALVFLTP